MESIKYKDLKLEVKKEFNEFEFDGKRFQTLKYLSVKEKHDILMISLQKSQIQEIYNELLLDIYFHLNLVYCYTNVEFSQEDRKDELKLYDELKSSGFLDSFLISMEKEEYDTLLGFLTKMVETSMEYNTTAASIIKSIINDLPKNAEIAAKFVENFDEENYKNVVRLAEKTGIKN